MSKHQKRHVSEPEELASWRDWVTINTILAIIPAECACPDDFTASCLRSLAFDPYW